MTPVHALLLSLPFTLCLAGSQPSDQPAACTGAEARRMMMEFPAHRRHRIAVRIDDRISTAARTEHDRFAANTCTLVFRSQYSTEIRSIAHEVCHCAADYSVLDGDSYDMTKVSAEEIQAREVAAIRCESWLVRQTEAIDYGLHAQPVSEEVR